MVRPNTGLTNDVSTCFDRHRMGSRIYDRVRTVQGTETKCVPGTPNGMRCALPLLIIVLIVRKVAGLSVRTFRILAYS